MPCARSARIVFFLRWTLSNGSRAKKTICFYRGSGLSPTKGQRQGLELALADRAQKSFLSFYRGPGLGPTKDQRQRLWDVPVCTPPRASGGHCLSCEKLRSTSTWGAWGSRVRDTGQQDLGFAIDLKTGADNVSGKNLAQGQGDLTYPT